MASKMGLSTFAVGCSVHWMWWPAIGGIGIGSRRLLLSARSGRGLRQHRGVAARQCPGGAAAWAAGRQVADVGIFAEFGNFGRRAGAAVDDWRSAGRAVARLAHMPGETQALWALMGMGAMLSGALGVPLTAILFSLELTHALPALLPLALACTASYLVTSLVMPRSILTEKLSRRGYHLSREYGVDPLEMVSVAEVMTELSAETERRVKRRTCGNYLRYLHTRMRPAGSGGRDGDHRSNEHAGGGSGTGPICGSISAQELLTGRRRAVVRESERSIAFQLEPQ